ncbi:MAG: hypothetical protein Q4G25_05915 [Paracoccus sp. (in: a-proteobacteria)]|nr:hypothetical protein [Paracoccus sp. (in: a-proteobacteria)]
MNEIVDESKEADEFSVTHQRGEICLPCQEGNLFRLSLPGGASCPFTLMAEVGGKCSPNLPENQGYMLPNDLIGTSGALNFLVNGRPYRITDDVRGLGNVSRPQDVRSHVIMDPLPPLPPRPAWLDQPPLVPIGRSSMRPAHRHGSIPRGHEYNALDAISEDRARAAGAPPDWDSGTLPAMPSDPIVMVVEPPVGLGAVPPEGEYDVATMPDALVNYFVATIYALTSDLPGDVTRSGVDAILQTRNMLADGNNRRFLREMVGARLSIVGAAGRRCLIYQVGPWKSGHLWYRQRNQYGRTGFGNIRVSAMNIVVQGMGRNIADGLRGMSGRAGAIGMVFAVGFDIAEYIANDGEKFLSDLLISIGFTLANAALSIVVGAMIATASIALAAAAGLTLAPMVIVGIGIGAVVGVGFAINRIIGLSGLKTSVQEFARGVKWYDNIWKSGMTDAEIYEGMMIAP